MKHASSAITTSPAPRLAWGANDQAVKSALLCRGLRLQNAQAVHAAVTGNQAALAQTLARALGVTLAIARFAASLLRELDVHQTCQKVGVRDETGRTYLKQLYLQTGTRSQVQLVVYLRVLRKPPGFLRYPLAHGCSCALETLDGFLEPPLSWVMRTQEKPIGATR